MITSASKNKDLAAEFLAYMIEAKTQNLSLTSPTTLPQIPPPPLFFPPEEKKSLHLDDPTPICSSSISGRMSPPRKYNEIWNEVKARNDPRFSKDCFANRCFVRPRLTGCRFNAA